MSNKKSKDIPKKESDNKKNIKSISVVFILSQNLQIDLNIAFIWKIYSLIKLLQKTF